MSIPNLITLGRILLVPVVFWLLAADHVRWAFVVFLVAGLSDALDGYLAKRFGWETELGAYLDPLADKMLLVCVFVAMGQSGGLPLWLVVLVVSRDVMIVAAVILAWLLDHPVKIRPLVVSKANTVAQIVLAAVAMAEIGFDLGLGITLAALVWVTGALTVLSLAAYMRAWTRHMSGARAASIR